MLNNRTDIDSPQFVIERDEGGLFRYSFVASTRAMLSSSAGFTSIDEAKASIERLRGVLRSAGWVQRQAGPDGGVYWFEIVETDGKVLGCSVRYPSRFARELAIERLELDAHSAPLVMRDA